MHECDARIIGEGEVNVWWHSLKLTLRILFAILKCEETNGVFRTEDVMPDPILRGRANSAVSDANDLILRANNAVRTPVIAQRVLDCAKVFAAARLNPVIGAYRRILFASA